MCDDDDGNNAVLWYLTSIKAVPPPPRCFEKDTVLTVTPCLFTGNPSETKWQIPQQGMEEEICHTV